MCEIHTNKNEEVVHDCAMKRGITMTNLMNWSIM